MLFIVATVGEVDSFDFALARCHGYRLAFCFWQSYRLR